MFISHKLDEVLAVADDITVIRRGTTVDTVLPGDVTARQLAELMVGSELPTPETRESTVTDVIVLPSTDDLAGRPGADRCSRTSRSRSTAARSSASPASRATARPSWSRRSWGCAGASRGPSQLGDDDITDWSTRRREAGIGYIPEDRHRHGLLLDAPLWENRILGHQTERPNVSGPWIDRRGARADTERIVRDYDVRTPGIDVLASALSGGNQQKLIVGREMSGDPKVLIASHPTRGVDVGAQAAIWDHIREARRNGLAVLLISADLDELIGLSDALLGDPTRDGSSPTSTRPTSPREARLVHDRRPAEAGLRDRDRYGCVSRGHRTAVTAVVLRLVLVTAIGPRHNP